MKIIIFILAFIAFAANSQDTAFFRTGNENTIFNYQVQKSKDTASWISIATLEKGKNFYWYVLPKQNETNYFRVQASGLVTYVTRPIKIPVKDSVVISKAVFYSTALVFSTTYESNINYFWIQKTRNGSTSTVTKIAARGPRDYIYKYYKTIYTYTYKVTAIFYDGLKSNSVTFK